MRHKPIHTCFNDCAGCAFELGESLAKRKSKESANFPANQYLEDIVIAKDSLIDDFLSLLKDEGK